MAFQCSALLPARADAELRARAEDVDAVMIRDPIDNVTSLDHEHAGGAADPGYLRGHLSDPKAAGIDEDVGRDLSPRTITHAPHR